MIAGSSTAPQKLALHCAQQEAAGRHPNSLADLALARVPYARQTELYEQSQDRSNVSYVSNVSKFPVPAYFPVFSIIYKNIKPHFTVRLCVALDLVID